jgi:hypothetical protein
VKCDEVQPLIEEYHYGELDADKAGWVRSHVAECVACAGLLEELKSEDEVYHRYAKTVDGEIEVSPAIWNGVQSVISPEPGAEDRWSRLSAFLSSIIPGAAAHRQVAFVVSLVVLSIVGTVVTMKLLENPSATRMELSQFDADQNSLEYAVLTIQRAEREYLAAIDTLGELVANLQPPMNAALRAELEQSLRIIDENLNSMREAFYTHPTDPELAHYLLAAYSRKVELLQEFAGS